MFGFRGGELPETVARKKGYRLEAQSRWPFLTHFDLSIIKNPAQLASMVKDREWLTRFGGEYRRGRLGTGKRFLTAMAVEDHPRYHAWNEALKRVISAERSYYAAVMGDRQTDQIQLEACEFDQAGAIPRGCR